MLRRREEGAVMVIQSPALPNWNDGPAIAAVLGFIPRRRRPENSLSSVPGSSSPWIIHKREIHEESLEHDMAH
jgi:hypothetical protein